jgi:hypothetical protein
VLGPAAIVVAVACHAGAPPAGPALADRFDRAARACAVVTSCAHPHDPPRQREPSACVEAWLARAPANVEPLETCLAAAVGCGQVDACVRGRRDDAAAAYCHAHPGARTGCEGNHLVTCSEDDPGESTSTDCAAFGARCGDSKQSGGLLARGCLSAVLCPAGAPEVRCDSPAAIISCHEGAVQRTTCAPPARCEERRGADGAVSAECEPSARRHCETDCAALGLVCDDRAEAAACVAPGARGCDKAPPRCEGDALAFCAAGRRFRLVCRDLGFSACDPDAHGMEAACTAAPAGAPALRP